MITNTECALQGQFKVDIYNKENHLVDTTDWFNNYITNTGLFYPLTYSFADCFRFLSLGSSSSANTDATTGLVNPMSSSNKFSVVDENGFSAGFQYVSHWGKEAYHAAGPPPDYATPGSCGAQHHKTGPLLFRGWTVPSGNFFVSKNLNINEFAVSPSSGADPSGSKAFSRIVKPIIIPSGTRSIISYRLKLGLDYNIRSFSSGTFSTGGADVSEGSQLLETLGNLSGIYRQVYHGFRLIDNQGRTYTPKYGEAMEPSTKKLEKLSLYLSPLYSQFSINENGGPGVSSGNGFSGPIPYSSGSGLYPLSYGHSIINVRSVGDETGFYDLNPQEQSTIPEEKINVFGIPAYTYLLKNIRLKSSDNPFSKAPSLENLTSGVDYDFSESVFAPGPMALATQAEHGYDSSYLDQGFKCSFASNVSNLSFSKAQNSGRTKTFTRKATFSPVNNFDWNTRYGAMVYAYRNGENFYPVIDTLFYNHSGRASSDLDYYRDVGVSWTQGNQLGSFGFTIGTDVQNLETYYGGNQANIGQFVNYGAQGLTTGRSFSVSSGAVYWPSTRVSPQQIKLLSIKDVTYVSPNGLSVSDPNFFFNSGNQIIDKVSPSYNHGGLQDGKEFPLAFEESISENSYLGSVFYTGWNYQTDTSYEQNVVISYNGLNYASIDYSSGIDPATGTNHWMFLNDAPVDSQVYGESTLKFRTENTNGYYVVYDDAYSNRQLLPYGGGIQLSGYSNGSGIFPVNFTSQTISPVDIITGLPYVYNNVLIPKNVARVISVDLSTYAKRGSGKGWMTDQFTDFTYGGLSGSTPIYVALVTTRARTYGNAFPWQSSLTFEHIPSGKIYWTNFQRPTGIIQHTDSLRFMPNHGVYAQDLGNDTYPLGSGGYYPGLSSLNSLDVYLTTTWSA